MFGIPDWAIGVSVLIVAFFGGVGALLRLMPPEMRLSGRKRLAEQERVMLEELQQRLVELDELRSRLAEVEERQDFNERLMSRGGEAERLGPPTPR
jgi:Tfp pilus assembly protein PilO